MKIIAILLVTLLSQFSQALPIHQQLDFVKAQKVFAPRGAYNFLGIVKLSGCSGSLIRFEGAKDSDPGLILTNGHCVSTGMGGMMAANVYLSHQPSQKTFQFLNADGSLMSSTVKATELVYGTITWNDVAIYSLELSYAQIKKKLGVDALIMDSVHPKVGEGINVLSGYWQQGYSCKIDRFAFELHEAEYVSKDSMRYSKGGCETIHGTSGSPVISVATGRVIGINSTGNDDGQRCTMDNPCEVSENGQVYVEKGRSYADQTYVFYSCLDSNQKINLKLSGCKLYH